jgi:hypothetical protein
MNRVPDEHRLFWTVLFGDQSLASSVQKLAALSVLLVAIFTLAGWVFASWFMVQAPYGLSTLHPLTSLGLVLLGFSLRLGRQEKLNRSLARFSVFLSLGVAAIGLLTLVADHGDTGQALLKSILSIGDVKFLPSPASGISLMLLGLISFLRVIRRSVALSQALLGLVSFLCLAAILEAIYGASFNSGRSDSIHGPTSWWLMEIPAASLILLAAITMLIRLANRGALATLDANSASRTIARTLLPASILVPIALGWLRLIAEAYGWMPTRFGLLFHVLASIALMLAIVWRSIRDLTYKSALPEEVHNYTSDLESSYRELLNICDRPIFSYNNKGEITYSNAAAELFFEVQAPSEEKTLVQTMVGELAWNQHFAPMLLGLHGSHKVQTITIQNQFQFSFNISVQIVNLYRSKVNIEILVFVSRIVDSLTETDKLSITSRTMDIDEMNSLISLQQKMSDSSLQIDSL